MNKETLERLDALAAKLQTTSDHIWQVLLRQAPIEIWMDVFWIVATLILVGACFYSVIRMNTETESPWPFNDEFWQFAFWVTLVLGGVGVFVSIFCFIEIPTLIWNPEFWALKQITQAFK